MQELKNTFILLRIPFSVYLMPIFLFALSQTMNYEPNDALILFFLLHILIYPASNGYNSYMDRDTEAIGGLEHPPPVSKSLFYVTLGMDFIAICTSIFLFNIYVALLLVGYILASRAYSYKGIRLKRFPIISFLVVFLFQGAYVYLMLQYALTDHFPRDNMLPAVIASLIVGGGYPLTQIYQHASDAANEDKTLSMLLGIRGTFFFSMILFMLVIVLLFLHFRPRTFYWFLFLVFNLPVLIYFNQWMFKAFKKETAASYANTMMMNNISAICMNSYFLLLVYFSLNH